MYKSQRARDYPYRAPPPAWNPAPVASPSHPDAPPADVGDQDPASQLNIHLTRTLRLPPATYTFDDASQRTRPLFRGSATAAGLTATPDAWAPSKRDAKLLAALEWLNLYRDAPPTDLLTAYAAAHGLAPPIYAEHTSAPPRPHPPSRRSGPDSDPWYRAHVTLAGHQVWSDAAAPSVNDARNLAAAQWLAQHARGGGSGNGTASTTAAPIEARAPAHAEAIVALNLLALDRYRTPPTYEFDQRGAPYKRGKVPEFRAVVTAGGIAARGRDWRESKKLAKEDAAQVWLDQNGDVQPRRPPVVGGSSAQGNGSQDGGTLVRIKNEPPSPPRAKDPRGPARPPSSTAAAEPPAVPPPPAAAAAQTSLSSVSTGATSPDALTRLHHLSAALDWPVQWASMDNEGFHLVHLGTALSAPGTTPSGAAEALLAVARAKLLAGPDGV
ncbi:hypothetical protein AMAG_09248 [Allomyces macrogynus ATCC 38327]|uniref:DRBM domain-containing protein n=1 Tax=Allomyces macrogynus (strain ATCC 38327) TaxID=578462 RepID=A0A0L0SPA2_ALLM3|nr:hypothetical protein AMAG_09248 [Allomyces macrogynus ATCC 38327]|eukprot:KNE64205.1 hypothetical protein AMAG_09248 [Allomyces macrogynus ATCC 38327]